MERIVRGRSATLTKTFTFTPTGTPTVAVTRSTGATVTVGSVSGAGTTWTYTIPASSNTLLDTYTATWAAVTGGESQSFVDTIEVAGGTFFTLAELRAQLSGTYTDDEILDMRTRVEQEIERELAFACVPRYTFTTLNGPGGPSLMLSPYTTSIRSITVDGVALTAPELAALTYGLTGTVYRSSGWWSCGVNNIVVGYEHGLSVLPGGCDRVAKILAKSWLVGQRSPIDDRAITFSTNDLGSYSLAVPGRGGSIFGIPDVDAWVQSKTLKTGIA